MAVEMLAPSARRVESYGPRVESSVRRRTTALLVEAGLDPALLAVPHARLSHSLVCALLKISEEVSGDRAFGLRAGMALQEADQDVYGYLLRSAPTIGAFTQVAARYMPLMHDGFEVIVEVSGKRVAFSQRVRAGLGAPAGVNEFATSVILRAAQVYSGVDRPASEVHFVHERPGWAGEYEPVLGAKVRFGEDYNRLVYPLAVLDVEMPHGDPGLHACLARTADRLLEALPRSRSFAVQVREVVRKRLARGDHQLPQVASALRTSERSLRRRLASEGTSHSEIVDDARRERALEYLADRSLDLGEISAKLGFAHPPAFQRAFKRWFGVGPRKYRNEQLGNPFWRTFVSG